MEQRGLVRRERARGDRRIVNVSLTASGHRLIAAVFPKHAETVTKQLAALTAREQEQLRRLCRKLGTSLGKK